MKKTRVLFLACLTFIAAPIRGNVCNNCPEDHSHTYMFTRPLTEHLGIEQAMWHDIVYKKQKGGTAVQVTAAYQQSVTLEQNSNYFLFPCNRDVLVSGDDNTGDARTRDIRAEWLGLPSNFRGRFTVSPHQKQAGVIVEASKDLHTVIDHDYFKGSWFNIVIPAVYVENNLRLRQWDVINPGTTFPADIVQAMRQPNWLYAKMGSCCSKTALADLTFKLGKTYLCEDNNLLAYYTKLIAPTGNRQNPAFIFSPVSGNNNHFGYGGGVYMQLLCNNDPTLVRVLFFLNFESIFFARNDQWRTFDLRGKPMSRYMQFVDTSLNPGATIPGVNVLTLLVDAHPYGYVDFSAGFRLQLKKTEWEFGYNIWGHVQERIELECPFPAGRYGIAGSYNPNLIPNPLNTVVTASKSTIAMQAPNDVIISPCPVPCTETLTFVPLNEGDIDFRSGAAGPAFNHKVHISVGSVHRGEKVDAFWGFGIFYDLPMKYGALCLMGGWLKGGASF